MIEIHSWLVKEAAKNQWMKITAKQKVIRDRITIQAFLKNEKITILRNKTSKIKHLSIPLPLRRHIFLNSTIGGLKIYIVTCYKPTLESRLENCVLSNYYESSFLCWSWQDPKGREISFLPRKYYLLRFSWIFC